MDSTKNIVISNWNIRLIFALIILFRAAAVSSQDYPEGFTEEIVYDQFFIPTGYIPVNEEISYVFELNGKVWAIENGTVLPDPILDIEEEVGMWADHGLLGVTIDPNFEENGFIYLLYNVDRHHLQFYGTSDYDPEVDDTYKGGMGRVTRYTVDTGTFTSIDEDSRIVILGENIGDGIPIPADSHGVGDIEFGEDGSLLISTGDANSFWCCYNGEGPVPDAAYDSLSYQDGILRSDELVGAFRSQYLAGLNGKILRIHPETGEGLPSNPFFVESAPDSAMSKVWALGFRNPFRMTIKPGTGFGDLESGHPGELYVSDVGESQWEELNLVRDGGSNHGWPIYEGQKKHIYGYPELLTRNTLAPNPLFGANDCQSEFINYQDLLLQENQQHEYFFPNPCDPFEAIPESIVKFGHERPAIAYANVWSGPPNTELPGFDDDGNAFALPIDHEDSRMSGDHFEGSSGNGGTFIYGEKIPEEYQNWMLLSDFAGWLRAFEQYDNGDFKTVETWQDSIGRAVSINFNPFDGCVYVCTYFPSYIKRICFGGNLKPIINVTPDTVYGSSPLLVNFDASESYDPEGEDLSFEWDFGDGNTGTGDQISHTFDAGTNSTVSYTVKLNVQDESGAESSTELLVSLNNTPPEVDIISIEEGDLYSTEFPMLFNLEARTVDLEHGENDIAYEWTYRLQHNSHFHILETLTGNGQSIIVTPTHCEENETYWYRVLVTATDPGGLVSKDERNIYPDCEGVLESSIDAAKGYIIVPNPVTDNELEVRSVFDLGNQVEYQINDSEGRLVSNGVLPIYNDRKFFTIDVTNLSSAAYILRFTALGNTYTERFVVINN